jgi:hypothetical protein
MSWYKDMIKSMSGYDLIEQAKQTEQMPEKEVQRRLINDMLFSVRMKRLDNDLQENYNINEEAIEQFILDYAKRRGLDDL